MGRVGVEFLQHAGDLAQLVHQSALRMQATGGIGDQHIGAARARCLQRIENHAGRIGILALRYHRDLVAFAPGLELLDGGGAEGVAGGEDHLVAFVAIAAGELADGGGLADAVDADGKDDERLAASDNQRCFDRLEQADQRLPQRGQQGGGIGELALVHALAQILDQVVLASMPTSAVIKVVSSSSSRSSSSLG